MPRVITNLRIPLNRGYSENTYYIEDLSETSPNYFNIDFFPTVVGGGSQFLKLKGNGEYLAIDSSLDVEFIDASGQRIYTQVANYSDRFNNYYISFDIYDITAQGIATAYFVGKARLDQNGALVPEEKMGGYNVRWSKQFMVLPYERNNAQLIFDSPPIVSVAQVVTPAKIKLIATASANTYTTITGSSFTITSTLNEGYDRDFATSKNIFDPRTKGITIDPTNKPKTVNSVVTAIREEHIDITNGVKIKYVTRFGTILTTPTSFFKREHVGSYFDIYLSGSILPTSLLPDINTIATGSISISGSLITQIDAYNATIVDVISSTQAVLSKPVSVKIIDPSRSARERLSNYTYKSISGFTGSLAYIPSDTTYITSSVVSSSYVEFTYSELNPIGGEVYRIKTSTRLGSETGEYKLLNDQIITPVEYLTDAEFLNSANYVRDETNYKMVGYFIDQLTANTYWNLAYETPTSLNLSAATASIVQTPLSEAAKITSDANSTTCFTTRYFQNFSIDQMYTMAFTLILDPYTELEIYVNSEPLSLYVIYPLSYPRAFIKTSNLEKERYHNDWNRFGKYVGRVKNNTGQRMNYGRVMFDLSTDSSGFGRPLFRVRTVDYTDEFTGAAYISEVSLKPYTLNGFTPDIVQYAVPLTQDLITATQVTQSIDFKVEYFDYSGVQSEYTTYLENIVLNLRDTIPSSTCQDDKLYFYFNSIGNSNSNPNAAIVIAAPLFVDNETL